MVLVKNGQSSFTCQHWQYCNSMSYLSSMPHLKLLPCLHASNHVAPWGEHPIMPCATGVATAGRFMCPSITRGAGDGHCSNYALQLCADVDRLPSIMHTRMHAMPAGCLSTARAPAWGQVVWSSVMEDPAEYL